MRQFTFSSRLQRMSVITRTLGSKNFDLYAKGAPEMIASLSRPETGNHSISNILLVSKSKNPLASNKSSWYLKFLKDGISWFCSKLHLHFYEVSRFMADFS